MLSCATTLRRLLFDAPKDHGGTYHDSGATSHVFHSDDAFVPGSLRKCSKRTVMLTDQSSVVADRSGVVLLPFEKGEFWLKSVLLIPGLGYNLVSVGRFADNGIEFLFTRDGVQLCFRPDNFFIGHGIRDAETRLYSLPGPNMPSKDQAAAIVTGDAGL